MAKSQVPRLASAIFFRLTWSPVTIGWLAACKKHGRPHAFGWVLPSVVKCIFLPLSWSSDILNPSWVWVPWKERKCKHSWVSTARKVSFRHIDHDRYIWHSEPCVRQQWSHRRSLNSNMWFSFPTVLRGVKYHTAPSSLTFASLHQVAPPIDQIHLTPITKTVNMNGCNYFMYKFGMMNSVRQSFSVCLDYII